MQILDNEYKQWLFELKSKIRSSQIKATLALNAHLVSFYWELGKMIAEKQKTSPWGSKLLDQISKDLKVEFPEMKGFSVTNLKYCKLFYLQFTNSPQVGDELNIISPQAGDDYLFSLLKQIPWGHIKLIIDKVKDNKVVQFYAQQTIENAWGRETLALQIKSQLFARQGKSITNFKNTLPEPLSDLAQQTLKDPYVFDFVTMFPKMKERDLEKQLVTQISKFLLELGKGFAFVGQQYPLEIGEKEYFLDLLFYHIKLKCYVVVELKNTAFIPEYTGKMNFYLSAVDTLLKQDDDKPTIGILLCRDKNNIEAEFALRDINKPIGISEFLFTEILPEELKSSLPTIEEIENELLNRTDTSDE
ncbi:PDDEXK nuclease domain-containing protein [Flavobacterium marginilacus]|uniref:PDDEXK nuclease domain-containing protein n=1 Tax=Flavobacterium marginilacus TaxID=3003256 RepID=UPI00248E36F7|nr:PDDEXK nuclease domain-containing protein [Flavobacterium marginilacus]